MGDISHGLPVSATISAIVPVTPAASITSTISVSTRVTTTVSVPAVISARIAVTTEVTAIAAVVLVIAASTVPAAVPSAPVPAVAITVAVTIKVTSAVSVAPSAAAVAVPAGRSTALTGGNLDADGATVNLHASHLLHSLLGILSALHGHEGVPTGAASGAVDCERKGWEGNGGNKGSLRSEEEMRGLRVNGLRKWGSTDGGQMECVVERREHNEEVDRTRRCKSKQKQCIYLRRGLLSGGHTWRTNPRAPFHASRF